MGQHIYGYHLCEHAIFLDFFGDPARKREPDEALRLLFRRGQEHEERVASTLRYPQPGYPAGDMEAAHRATLALMAQGVPGIYQGVLIHDGYLGKPDLLRRVQGSSRFGAWAYEVGDVKSSRKVKAQQILQVTFYSHLLDAAQGAPASEGFLFLRDGGEERFRIDDYRWVLLDILEEIAAIRARTRRTVLGALEAGAPVTIRYAGGTKGPGPRVVSPLAFYTRHGAHYMEAIAAEEGMRKSFRLDGVIEVCG